MQKKKEAQAAVELMNATYTRIVEEEEAKKGLIIAKALYGKIMSGTIWSIVNNVLHVI